MTLPDPGTRSPGRLMIKYNSAGLEHTAAAWFKYPNDFGDITTIRGTATDFANALMSMCALNSYAHDWEIVDPNGIQLYTEPFSPIIDGAVTVADDLKVSQSFTLSAIGKAVPSVIGTAFSNTRTFVFTGYYHASVWTNPQVVPGDTGYNSDFRDFLDTSTVVGADFYGQGAEYLEPYNAQVNSHYQKRHGI